MEGERDIGTWGQRDIGTEGHWDGLKGMALSLVPLVALSLIIDVSPALQLWKTRSELSESEPGRAASFVVGRNIPAGGNLRYLRRLARSLQPVCAFNIPVQLRPNGCGLD